MNWNSRSRFAAALVTVMAASTLWIIELAPSSQATAPPGEGSVHVVGSVSRNLGPCAIPGEPGPGEAVAFNHIVMTGTFEADAHTYHGTMQLPAPVSGCAVRDAAPPPLAVVQHGTIGSGATFFGSSPTSCIAGMVQGGDFDVVGANAWIRLKLTYSLGDTVGLGCNVQTTAEVNCAGLFEVAPFGTLGIGNDDTIAGNLVCGNVPCADAPPPRPVTSTTAPTTTTTRPAEDTPGRLWVAFEARYEETREPGFRVQEPKLSDQRWFQFGGFGAIRRGDTIYSGTASIRTTGEVKFSGNSTDLRKRYSLAQGEDLDIRDEVTLQTLGGRLEDGDLVLGLTAGCGLFKADFWGTKWDVRAEVVYIPDQGDMRGGRVMGFLSAEWRW